MSSVFTRFWLKLRSTYFSITKDEELFFYASSLSFYTLFALIPLLLILFSVFLMFPYFQERIEELKVLLLSNIIPTNTQVVAGFLSSFMENSKKLGMIGSAYIIVTSVMFFRNYEYIASKMFDSSPRNFFDSIILYWAFATLFPIVLSASFYFGSGVGSFFGFELDLFTEILLHLVSWGLFFVIFRISANKNLSFRALIISSFFTMVAWKAIKLAFVYYVSMNKSYTTLYGSLSLILISMLWIYISWFVVLLGMRSCSYLSKYMGRD